MGELSHDIYAEAAKLRARIETLEAALKPFSEMADQLDRWQTGDNPNFAGSFKAEDLRRARTVLQQLTSGDAARKSNGLGPCPIGDGTCTWPNCDCEH